MIQKGVRFLNDAIMRPFTHLFLLLNSWPSADPDVNENARLFSKLVKDQCWSKVSVIKNTIAYFCQFPTVPGRDPKRWRRDAVGNIVSYNLRGCDGCLCHEYDHIIPYSKGGKSTLENCQILQQRVNRFKGNEDDDPQRLATYSCDRSFSGPELDVIEMALYGDIRDESGEIKCRCKSVLELKNLFLGRASGQRPPRDSYKYPNCE